MGIENKQFKNTLVVNNLQNPNVHLTDQIQHLEKVRNNQRGGNHILTDKPFVFIDSYWISILREIRRRPRE